MEPALLPESLRDAARVAREGHGQVPIVDETGVVVGLLFDPEQVSEELAILTDPEALDGLREGREDRDAGRLVDTATVLADVEGRQAGS